jgi:lysophospholipase L1-like esterase
VRRPGALVAGLFAAAAVLSSCTHGSAAPSAAGTTPVASPTSASSASSTSAGPARTAAPTTSAPTSPAPTTSVPTTDPRVVVGLGDSVTAGTACGCTDFVTQYAAMLGARSGHAVRPVNLGVGGLTTSSLTTQLSTRTVSAALSTADVVVVTIGANDLSPLVTRWQQGGCDTSCVDTASRAAGAGLSTVLAEVRRATPARARIQVTTYWNVFEDGDVADNDFGPGFATWSDAVTRSANTAIRAAAEADGDQVVDLYAPFEGHGERNPTPLLADDGDHPNAAGHHLIAQTLLAATPS